MAGPPLAAIATSPAPARWRPTWLGWLVLLEAVLLLAAIAWKVQLRPIASVLGLGLLGVMATNVWWSRRWLIGTRAELIAPSTLIAGEDTLLTIRLNTDVVAPPMSISGQAPGQNAEVIGHVAGLDADGARLGWSVRFPRRGWQTIPPLIAANEQPFGVGIAQRAISQPRELLVMPPRGLLRRELRNRLDTWLEQVATGSDPGEDELARLRPYRPGDPPRSVHWRASARARELLVSERHTPSARHLALVIDTDSAVVTPRRLDRLASIAATFIDHLIRRGWEVTLHGRFAPGGVSGDRAHLIATLAVIEPQAAEGELGDCLPRHRTCLVLSSRAIELPPRHPRPMLLTLDECEQLVRLPKRLGV